MANNMEISKDIKYIGVNDHQLDMFEGQYPVPNGMAYNSYIIQDEKTAVIDGIEVKFIDEWFDNIKNVIGDKSPDYLVVHHMEPDHSASIKAFTDKYPNAQIVASAQAFKMMENFFGCSFADKGIVVKEGAVLELGKHKLNFIGAPMVHWPEVLVSYEETEKVLFSADGFGKFGANDVDDDEWDCEARRYYMGIVGKYGANVQAVLKKTAGLDIKTICSLHGPVLKENLAYYIDLYDTWSSYRPETVGVTLAYSSVYGHTKEAALLLEEELLAKGVKVETFDLARCDVYEAIEAAFRYNNLVLATTTYNTGIFPVMHDYLVRLVERNLQNRTVAIIENGSWAPAAAKVIKGMLENSKDLTFLDTITIKSALSEENKEQLKVLADILAK